MLFNLFTLVLGVGSIYFFYQFNFFIGIVLLVLTILRLFNLSQRKIIKSFSKSIENITLEKQCNVSLEFSIIVEEVLNHKAVSDWFAKLKNINLPKDTTLKKWRIELLDNYKNKYKNQSGIERVKFNIKNNLLWKDGKIDFNDLLHHEFFIPYSYKNDKDWKKNFIPLITTGLTVRIFVVNGIIKLQIGEFSKRYSPKILNKKNSATYLAYETITSFPLMYFSYEHKVPEKYLNLLFSATRQYEDMVIKSKDKNNSSFDWIDLNKDMKDYNYICALSDDYIYDQEIIKNFEDKKTLMLEKEGFKDRYAKEKECNDTFLHFDYMDNDICYFNNLVHIDILNFNNYKEQRERYCLLDHREDKDYN